MILASCATLGLPQADTFNKRLAAGYTTVTGVRNTADTLLTSNKITADDAQNVQAQADNGRTGLDLARQIHATNPPAGDAKLDAVVTGLSALEAYLRTRGK
jgi:hypothetical protein